EGGAVAVLAALPDGAAEGGGGAVVQRGHGVRRAAAVGVAFIDDFRVRAAAGHRPGAGAGRLVAGVAEAVVVVLVAAAALGAGDGAAAALRRLGVGAAAGIGLVVAAAVGAAGGAARADRPGAVALELVVGPLAVGGGVVAAVAEVAGEHTDAQAEA